MPLPGRIEIYSDEETPPLLCHSAEDVEVVLHDLHQNCRPDRPLCVVVQIPEYHICIGVGSDPTFVEVHVSPYDGEYYTSLGDGESAGWKDFYGCGDYTPVEASSLVPFEDAVCAVSEFVRHQRRSMQIHWKDWNGRAIS